MNSSQIIFEALRKLVALKRSDTSREVVEMYVEILSEYDPKKVLLALKKCMTSMKYFPDISEIINIINPEENETDQAYDVIKEIMDTIRACGSHQAVLAKESMSEVAWNTCEALGGYAMLCRMSEDDLNIMRAQARDIAKGQIKREVRESNLNPNQIGNESKLYLG